MMRPEQLAALRLKAGGAKRRERLELLLPGNAVTREEIDAVLRRHGEGGG
ncbi:MAG: hypothetical protein ACYCWW_02090 [Deltaproteobacteria bacterium]